MDCIFCKIANKQVSSFVLFEDNDIIAVLDIYPANPGHTIIFPKKHFPRFEEIPDSIIGKMFVLAKYISSIFTSSLKADGINLYLASGEHAGQRVPHIILHVIPRYKEDGIQFEWTRKQLNPQAFQQIQNIIVSALNVYNTDMKSMEGTYTNETSVKEDLPKDEKVKKEEKNYNKMFIWFLRKI